jgi:pimeloyl-ACP methyl ester carboxylesterase
MPQNFLECDREQVFLMPPDPRDWLPEGHVAWFVLASVEEMDLSVFYGSYRQDGWGRAAFEPSMMVCEMDQMIRPYPTRAAIRSIACPVTVIEGDLSDPAFARAVGFVMGLLPQARLVSLPGAAHMLHVDQPEGWVEVVTQRIDHAPSPAAMQSCCRSRYFDK